MGHRARRSWRHVFLVGLGLLTGAGPAAGAYRYYRFVPTALRDAVQANSVQIAEFQILLDGVRIGGAAASNPGGNNPGNEGPQQGNDNNLDTKWLDFNKFTPLMLDFGTLTEADGYRLATANDSEERDPVSWRVEGSAENLTWETLNEQANYATPTARKTYLSDFPLPPPVGPRLPRITFTAAPLAIQAGQSSTLSWTVTDATSVSIDQGIGPVAASGSRSISPAATTLYTLTASGPGGANARSVEVVVGLGGLAGTTYDTLEGDSLLDPISNLIGAPPSATFLQVANLDYENNFVGALPGLTSSDSFAVLWRGWLDVTREGYGLYTFGTESDDGSMLYLDLNEDGDFSDPGERVVDNNGIHPKNTATGTVDLQMDSVRIALGFYEAGGGEAIRARFKKGGGLSFSALDPISGLTGHFVPQDPAGNAPRITSFTAQPAVILEGETSTLNWTTLNGVSATLVGEGPVPLNGSLTVTPPVTTTYTLQVTGSDSRTVSRQATVTVRTMGAFFFRYYRFTPTEFRGAGNSVQLSEFDILSAGVELPGAVASNPGGSNPGGEQPTQAVDGLLNTKWLDYNKGPLVLDFGAPVLADSYRWATANDSEDRDPVSWRVEASNDQLNWVLLDLVTGYATPLERLTYLPEFPFQEGLVVPLIVKQFRVSPVVVANPTQPVTLTWDVEGANVGLEITGTVAPAPRGSIVPSLVAGLNTFTLTAMSDTEMAQVSVRVLVGNPTGGVHRHFRFTPIQMRNPSGREVQLAEFHLYQGETPLTGAMASNPGGAVCCDETPDKLLDNNLETKWLDYAGKLLFYDFGVPVAVNGYRMASANDADGRDPVSWDLEGSDDLLNWYPIDSRRDYGTYLPLARKTWAELITFKEPLVITRATYAPERGLMTLEWGSNPGEVYWIEFNDDLGVPELWLPLEWGIPAAATGTRTSYDLYLFLPGPPLGFFRIGR